MVLKCRHKVRHIFIIYKQPNAVYVDKEKVCVCVLGGVLWNAEVDDYYDLFSFLY